MPSNNKQTDFEKNNIFWKYYAIICMYCTIIYFFLIYINIPIGDYNHFFAFISLWTGIIWLVAKIKWKKQQSYIQLKNKKPKWLEWSVDIFPFVLIFFLARGFLYEQFKIPSGSMEPNLYAGDIVLVNKFNYSIKSPISSHVFVNRNKVNYGDIIVFKYPPNPNIYYVKRVVGLPGDILEYNFQEKKLFINKKEINRTFISENFDNQIYKEQLFDSEHLIQLNNQNSYLTIPSFEGFLNKENCTFNLEKMTCTISNNFYFAMGDNRDNSLDSRFWGFVPQNNIAGKVSLSINLIKLKLNYF